MKDLMAVLVIVYVFTLFFISQFATGKIQEPKPLPPQPTPNYKFKVKSSQGVIGSNKPVQLLYSGRCVLIESSLVCGDFVVSGRFDLEDLK
jgi:hypothetical protein